jgi:hypothetical protein
MSSARWQILAAFAVATIAVGLAVAAANLGPSGTSGMGDMAPGSRGTVPPVNGYLDGMEIRFLHTEASDPQVADMLTKMMGSPVLVVPSLAQVPQSALANVYVFKNGIRGDGPFGFQPDVFENGPDRSGYSPLRAVHLVTWKDAGKARLLRSADDVKGAEVAGEIAIERPGAVVNMPLLSWPGGSR